MFLVLGLVLPHQVLVADLLAVVVVVKAVVARVLVLAVLAAARAVG
jgi:hypothetical protein